MYVRVRSPGAISNAGESMVQFRPSDARYSSRIWENACASGLYTDDQQTTGRCRRDQCAVRVDDRLRGGAAACRDGDDGDVVVVDDIDQCRGVCQVDAVGGSAFGCLAGAGVGVDPMAAGDCFCCGACADHAGCADDCDVHEGFFSGRSSVVFLAVFRVMVL